MLRRILHWLVLLPAAAVLAAISLANTHEVQLSLDPFRPDNPALALVLPFYAWLLAALMLGVLIGGLTTWVSQARWRRSARRSEVEAQRQREEAARLSSERKLEAARH